MPIKINKVCSQALGEIYMHVRSTVIDKWNWTFHLFIYVCIYLEFELLMYAEQMSISQSSTSAS